MVETSLVDPEGFLRMRESESGDWTQGDSTLQPPIAQVLVTQTTRPSGLSDYVYGTSGAVGLARRRRHWFDSCSCSFWFSGKSQQNYLSFSQIKREYFKTWVVVFNTINRHQTEHWAKD